MADEDKARVIHDKDIREPLFDYLEETYGKIRILEEKMMGRSRADVVMITENGLVGIEIKSDADSYARLSRQVKDYDRYYDYNIAVVGTRHAGSIKEHVPEWWGVITVEELDGVTDFYYYRKPQQNPNVDSKRKISILWRPELNNILEINHLPKYTGRSKKYVAERILAAVPEDVLTKQICEELFERDYTRIDEIIEEFRKEQAARRSQRKRAAGGRRK